MLKLFKYFWTGLTKISPIEFMLLIFDVAAIAYMPRYCFDYYLWTIVLFCDLGLIVSHGAWIKHARYSKPFGESVPWQRTEGVIVRGIMLLCIVSITQFSRLTNNEVVSTQCLKYLSYYCWYLVEFIAVYELFYSILKTLHAHNSSWLEGTKGHIGIPNVISIIRIALALCVPHIYALQSFGQESNTVASIVLGLALATDAIDGYLARSTNQTTKAGKALDPLGDKLIFYPVAAGFYFATGKQFIRPLEVIPAELAYTAAILIILRDALIILWFCLYGKNYSQGISAGYADKIRTIVLSAWLVSTSLAIAIPETSLGIAMIWISWGSLLLAGIISPFSFVIDVCRVVKIKKKQSYANSKKSP